MNVFELCEQIQRIELDVRLDVKRLMTENWQLEKENGQLRERIRELEGVANEKVCRADA